MEGKVRARIGLAAAVTVLLALTISARPQKGKQAEENLVRLMKAESIELMEMDGQQYRKAIKSTFLHNGTYLISDTALWNVTTKVINCRGHVKVIQDETILTSQKLDYYIDQNLAQFTGTLVQLQNKKRNILRTRYLDYNTKDSIAVFRNGGAMRDENGQVIESMVGNYFSRDKYFLFQESVNMFTDSVFVSTGSLYYRSEQERAEFPSSVTFWKGPNILSAYHGWYNRGTETFFFHENVHGMTKDQEVWADTLYFFRDRMDVKLLHNVQMQDSVRNFAAMGDYVLYRDTLKQVELMKKAAVVLFNETDGKRDTTFIGGDTLRYRHVRFCDIPDGQVKASKARLNDILTDAVTEYRRKAAEAAAEERKKAQEAADKVKKHLEALERKRLGLPDPEEEEAKAAQAAAEGESAEEAEGAEDGNTVEAPAPSANSKNRAAATIALEDTLAVAAARDSLTAPADSLVAAADSLLAPADILTAPADSLRAAADSAAAHLDSVLSQIDSLAGGRSPQTHESPALQAAPDSSLARTGPADSLATGPADSTAIKDSLAAPLDTTRYGFATAIGNVKVWRRDIQVRCDSMAFCDLDSVARFYRDPVVWNEGNRQYTADSLLVLVGGGGVRKASLQSNAFVITQDSETCFDQIKGAEIMAYFDSTKNTLQRFDAMGGASALFYLEENGVLATVNKVESKMLSAIMKDGTVDQVYYFENPKNNAYPVVQLPETESKMKGFSWRPDERPATPSHVTTIKLRKPQRNTLRSRKQPVFKQAEIYFPGYIKGIRREIAVRDSLARLPKPVYVEAPVDTVPPVDTLLARADSIAAGVDSLIAGLETGTAVKDSIGTVVKDIQAAADSTSAGKAPSAPVQEVDPLSVPTVDPKQKKLEERETRRKLRIAARDARNAAREKRWAELDSLDAAKAAAKQQKKLERERARKLRLLKAQQRREAREQAKLQKYIEKYRKQYEREQKSESARKRTQTTQTGGEVPTAPEPGEKAPRGDAVLGDDGPPDDDPLLGGGGIPGA